jgi:hypothetical protein
VRLLVISRDTGPQEDAPDVDVEHDVSAFEPPDRDAELSFENLDGHRGRLLSDSVEALKPALELAGGRAIVPDPGRIAAVVAHDAVGGMHDPDWDVVNVPVECGRPGHSATNALKIASDQGRIQMSEASLKLQGCLPCPFILDSLIEDGGEQEGKWVRSNEPIRRSVGHDGGRTAGR